MRGFHLVLTQAIWLPLEAKERVWLRSSSYKWDTSLSSPAPLPSKLCSPFKHLQALWRKGLSFMSTQHWAWYLGDTQENISYAPTHHQCPHHRRCSVWKQRGGLPGPEASPHPTDHCLAPRFREAQWDSHHQTQRWMFCDMKAAQCTEAPAGRSRGPSNVFTSQMFWGNFQKYLGIIPWYQNSLSPHLDLSWPTST